MSGAEAAGLALAVLPILVHATEHYNDVFRPFIRYKNCVREVDHFRQLLATQKIIFRNQCRLLLAAVTEYDVASSMLNGPEHPSWMDTKLDNQLIKLLAESREVCVSTIQLMQEELRKIGNECQAIWFEIDPSDQKPSDVKGSKAWRARVVKKLRFSVSKPRLDETLVSLRSLNEDFRTLSSQIIKTASYQPKVNTQRRSHCQHEIRKYNIIREASQQVYRALGNACTKHTEHQARFRIEVEQMTVNEGECSQVKFEMAFAHLTLTSPAQLGELVWFVVNSTTTNSHGKHHTPAMAVIESGLTHSLKRGLDEAAMVPGKKTKKSVRFQASLPIPLPTILPTFNNTMQRKDFCDVLRHYLGQPPMPSMCLCVLENTEGIRAHVYPTSPSPYSQRDGAVSLRHLISSTSRQESMWKVPIYQRMHLAKTLAIAVLQYHATPWLRTPWRSEDVLFFGLSEQALLQDSPTPMKPHLDVRVKGPSGQPSQVSVLPQRTFVGNPWLFGLGIVLLEIAHSSSLESFKRQSDLDHGREDQHTEFFLAQRVAASGFTDMGGKYHNIIQKLVKCDFGCGTDLNDIELQAAFHNEVICPLEKLENDLRQFHFDIEPS